MLYCVFTTQLKCPSITIYPPFTLFYLPIPFPLVITVLLLSVSIRVFFVFYFYFLLNPFSFFTLPTNPVPLWQLSLCSLYLWILYPSDSPSGNKSEETINTDSKEHKRPYVHCSVIHNSQDLEAAQVSIRWVDKKDEVHLYNGILLGHEKQGNLTFWGSMDGTGEYYAKWNKPVRERQIPRDLTYMWNLMNRINWWTK